jgi:hypothetical protein
VRFALIQGFFHLIFLINRLFDLKSHGAHSHLSEASFYPLADFKFSACTYLDPKIIVVFSIILLLSD